MPLIDRIEQALARGVDPDVFERAASALLQTRYPWLSPVEAGRDLGRDADIYRVRPEDPESRGRLLATTGDPLSNLKSSHKSWLKEQSSGEFRVDALVITTTNNLTGTTRKKIDEYCRLHGLPLPEYYGHRWLVDALKSDAHWRETLIGIRGRLDALVPASQFATSEQQILLGRESDLAALREHLDQRRDVVLSGVSGAGKSRILAELTDALQVEPLARDHLLDDLMALSPSTVILDDAHLRLDLLTELTRLRAQEGLSFRIVASCWPEETASTSSRLSEPAAVLLDLLPRVVMDEIVRGAGVTAVRTRHLILSQAEGRPGWALTLCSAVVTASGANIFSGEALLDHVLRHLRQEAGSVLTIDLLACIAALDGADHVDLEAISRIQNRPLPVVMNSLHQVATNGLVESRNGKWHLQAALSSALVSGWFFSASRSGSWALLVESFPNRKHELISSMLRAASATNTEEAVTAAHAWATGLEPAQEWDANTLSLVREYALVCAAAADFAADSARTLLSHPREPQVSLWGIQYDPLSDCAANILRTCARSYCNEAAVHGLLDMATTDNRPRNTHSDHPIRVIAELAQHLDPDRGSIFQVREVLLKHVMTWANSGTDGDLKWVVWAESTKEVLSPTVEGAWSDPGHFSNFTMASGVESAGRLLELTALWVAHVAPSLAAVRLATSGAAPVKALRHLVDLFGTWIRAAGGIGPGGSEVDADQRAAAVEGAWTILDSLRPWVETHAGVAHLIVEDLELARQWGVRPRNQWPAIVVDEDFEDFAGRRGVDSCEDWELQRNNEATAFAHRLLHLGPRYGTVRFIQVAQLAAAVEISGHGYPVPARVAEACEDPIEWLREAVAGSSAVLAHQFLLEALRRDMRVPKSLIGTALSTEGVRSAVIEAVVGGISFTETSRQVVEALTADDAVCLDRLFARDEADPLLAALLVHDVKRVRAQASLAFSMGAKHGPPLPPEWRDTWRAAFLETDAASVSDRSMWRLKKILEDLSQTDPALCADWFAHQFAGEEEQVHGALDRVKHVLRKLPRGERESLALKSVSEPDHIHLLPELIGYDAELSAALLRDGAISVHNAMDALSGERDAGAEILAPVLLDAGVTPQRIARQIFGSVSWSGPESVAIQAEIEWFNGLAVRNPRLIPVSNAAIGDLKTDYERALIEEKRERIRGR
ncbi:ATP-binding protein [Arthrobacter sp. 131MFCol6.1]|uniref:ATP-binding protein n=1 Tax=Arthrobacter sp. 131MFCol6.1 TaxID=1157944 RepID=UPI00039E2E7F|nr:ATP-binding protein [Arthrobacter sp. 131MFCol6.1]